MDEYITSQCIIEEYLNNWFTYEELAEYLCISIADVQKTLDAACEVDSKLGAKIRKHTGHIRKYYAEKDSKPFISGENKVYVDIAEFMIEHKASLNKTAKEFGIGKTTVFDYVHERLPDVSIVLYKQVFDVLTYNKSFSTNNKRVIEQVLTSYELLMQGKSSAEIAEAQQVGRNVVQRNLTGRLKSIDSQKYLIAQEILSENRDMALREYRFKPNAK